MRKSCRNNKWILYVHKNKINGKCYVGITSQSISQRWGKNGYKYLKQKKFGNAIRKYGWENFEHKVILDNLTLDEVSLLEQQYIQMLDSVENGYNVSTGGENGSYGVKMSEEQKQKLRDRKRTEEECRRISEAKKCKRPVICLETNKIYSSPHECADDFGVEGSRILSVCRGDGYTVKGLHFQYADDIKKSIEDLEEEKTKNNPRLKPVICLETNTYYESANECGRQLNLNGKQIRMACKIYGTVGGLHFKFANDSITLDEIKKAKNNSFRIKCIETGMIYESTSECASFFGVSSCSVICTCNGNQKSLKGYHLEFVDKKTHFKKVKCVTTGEIFPTVKECANVFNMNYSSFLRALTMYKGHWSHNGYEFQYC